TWSGDNVLPDNTFDPTTEGLFEAVYAINGCTDTLLINVFDIEGVFDLGPICQSEWPDTLDFSPLGGTWYGEGILDSLLGVYDPNEMTPGNQVLTYDVEGCDQAFTIEILEIQTGSINKNSCPDQAPFQVYEDFSPPGGYWEGDGIVDSITGLYDPSLVENNVTSLILYHAPNGCTDTTYMWNVYTFIPYDTVYFCQSDDPFPLTNDYIGRQPGGGQWTGSGLINPDGNYFEFIPTSVTPGEYLLTYTKNTCSDTVLFIVYPDQLSAPDISLCSDSAAFIIQDDLPSGGVWSGNGITDAELGLFDPSVSTVGESYVYWNSPAGCNDSIAVFVDEFFESELLNLESFYCFQDTSIIVQFTPEDATVSGAIQDSLFNPALIGEGQHEVYLQYEGSHCISSDTVSFFIFPEINSTLSASVNPICAGNGTILEVIADGGLPDSLLTYSWSNGLFPVSSNTVAPQETTTYFVETNDGCSDPGIDSITVVVLPPIISNISTSDTLCFGDQGWVSAVASPAGDYAYFWDNVPVAEGDQLDAVAGNSLVLEIEDEINGCLYDTLVLVPSYSPVAANFSVNPNADCIAFDANPLSFIDLSQHGLSGSWDFGNGEVQPYSPGSNPSVSYDQAGSYMVILEIQNEGGCPDTTALDICILPPTPLFIPDIFSPNGDGNNDILFVRGAGIVEINFMIYDRWGEQVFVSTNPDFGWDGQFRGKPSPSGVYVYHLTVALNSGIRQTLKGDITLIR
ncbi:MAG: gliding motility-associated C-terminal domain-containing protein, partial [Bacteroidota bacterium]